MFHEINFSPFSNNVLDYVGRPDLHTIKGSKVNISHDVGGFTLKLDGQVKALKLSNTEASYTLNKWQVGIHTKD